MSTHTPVTSREQLHHLVDELPDEELTAAERYLDYLCSLKDPRLHIVEEKSEDQEAESSEPS